MNLDKEYAGLFELIAWLKEFKAQQDKQQTHQPTLTVVPEPVQDELPMQAKPDDYKKLDRSGPNAGKLWSEQDTRIAWFAYTGGCTEAELAKYFGRTVYGIHQHIYKIKTGVVKL